MMSRALLGALAIATVMVGSAAAQTEAGKSGAQSSVPTVTIINKAPSGTAPRTSPELKVSPQSQGGPSAAPATEAAAGDTGPDRASTAADPSAPAAKSAAPAEPAEAAPPPEPTLAIDIDLTRQVMTVSEDGAARFTWPVSSARYGYRTPTGTYRPTWMAKMWYSRQYDDAPMPHAIFFHKGVAIHGSYATRSLGRPASHGCVRLSPRNASTLFKLVSRHGKERTQIVVHGKPDHSGARIASDERRGWGGPEQLRRGAPSYRYLPPGYYGRGYAAYGPPDYYYPPRTRRYYAAPRRVPRGYSYGYGF